MSHTEGKWRRYSDAIISDVPCEDPNEFRHYHGKVVCESVHSRDIPLLLAAPELLRVCKELAATVRNAKALIDDAYGEDEDSEMVKVIISKAEAAIAKAESSPDAVPQVLYFEGEYAMDTDYWDARETIEVIAFKYVSPDTTKMRGADIILKYQVEPNDYLRSLPLAKSLRYAWLAAGAASVEIHTDVLEVPRLPQKAGEGASK